MYLAEIWRYPVKSMAGERLERVTLGLAGIEDDRTIHVRNGRGRVVTARTHPQLLRQRAVTTGHGNTVVDGLSWAHPEIAAAIEKDVGPGALLVPDESLDRLTSCRCWWRPTALSKSSRTTGAGCDRTL